MCNYTYQWPYVTRWYSKQHDIAPCITIITIQNSSEAFKIAVSFHAGNGEALCKMTSILSLPNENLLQIIREVLPADLENFTQTCRLVHRLAGKILSTHRALVRQYRAIELSLRPSPVVNLVREFLDHSRKAHYVRCLQLEGCSPALFAYQLREIDAEILRDICSRSGWFSSLAQMPVFELADGAVSSQFSAIIVCLGVAVATLSMCNVSSMVIQGGPPVNLFCLNDTLQAISKSKTPVLSKLKSLRLESFNIELL